MFTPLYTIAKIRQNELVKMAAQGAFQEARLLEPLSLPVPERVLLHLGDLLITSGERLKSAAGSPGYQPMPVARK
jgi:hypothetical protein